MPSPVGHALAGLLVGLAIAPSALTGRGDRAAGVRGLPPVAAACWLGIGAGIAPDLDFLPGLLLDDPGRFHHGASHSLAAAALAGLIGAGLALGRAGRVSGLAALGPARAALVAALAVVAHALLDTLAVDTSAPYGVAFWWPFSDGHLASRWTPFTDIRREQQTTAAFVTTLLSWHNARAVLLEALLLGPPCLIALRLRAARRGEPSA